MAQVPSRAIKPPCGAFNTGEAKVAGRPRVAANFLVRSPLGGLTSGEAKVRLGDPQSVWSD
jgi:hypothetical protein